MILRIFRQDPFSRGTVTGRVTVLFKKLTFKAYRDSIIGSLEITVMIFMTIAASDTFGVASTFSGVGWGLLGGGSRVQETLNQRAGNRTGSSSASSP
jgi:hypothetical protein